MLPTNPESIDERFFKTLNEDIKLKPNQYKDDFGCRVHEIPKDNITNLNQYKTEKYIEDAVRRMRRVKTINYIQVTPYANGYNVVLSVTARNDEDVTLNMELK